MQSYKSSNNGVNTKRTVEGSAHLMQDVIKELMAIRGIDGIITSYALEIEYITDASSFIQRFELGIKDLVSSED